MTPVKFVSKSDKTNVENSEIGAVSEMLTSNTRQPFELSFNRFIQDLGGGAPVRDVGSKSPTKTGL